MTTKISHVRATPLYGGRSNTGVCTLLEVGGARILLDCGASLIGLSNEETTYIQKLSSDLIAAGGVDAILLSHADLNHVGGLPIISGLKGLQKVPVITTIPVMKFSQLVLYDYLCNLEMEGEDENGNKLAPYTFDDIDHAFEQHITLKYSQRIHLPETRVTQDRNKRLPVFITAVSAGRTIGGAIWRIQCGPAEILYSMDANLRKEVILDGVNMDLLPSAPVLMIADASCANRSKSSNAAQGRKKKDREDMQGLEQLVIKTLRGGGNVLVPVESSARIQEILLHFARYWSDNKLGMYHLVFLSHMSRNIMEYSGMLLEWMSDSLTRPFYNGKPNPLDLPQIKCIRDVKALDKFAGPKVVFASDASLSVGLAKEVLLKWGGDPRCKVVLTEVSDKSSLADFLRNATVPIIATVNRAMKVELSGKELADYKIEMEKKRKIEEEEAFRKKRQLELSQFTAQEDLQAEDEEEDQNKSEAVTAVERGRKRSKLSALWKILDANIQMFERQHPAFTVMDEFGCSIDDLKFTDIQSAESRLMPMRERNAEGKLVPGRPAPVAPTAPTPAPQTQAPVSNALVIPYKTQYAPHKVQFTCEFVNQSIPTGRMEFKAFKALLSRITPNKLLVIKGTANDCESVISYCKMNQIECYAPKNKHSVTFSMHADHLQIHIPYHLLPKNYARFSRAVGNSASGSVAGDCTVYNVQGDVQLTTQSWVNSKEGSRLLRFQGKTVKDEESKDEEVDAVVAFKDLLSEGNETLGAVSVGEITLNQLRQAFESAGMRADSIQGGVLLVNDQVLLKKENNSFSIEGPPNKTYYDVRRILYQQCAFV